MTDDAAKFLETIDLLKAGAISVNTALGLGRKKPSAVLIALARGHGCLSKPILLGDAPRVFLSLVCETMGLHDFLRAELPTVHPGLMATFVDGMLYPAPSAKEVPDDEVRYMKERWAGDHRIKSRVDRILADRRTEAARENR